MNLHPSGTRPFQFGLSVLSALLIAGTTSTAQAQWSGLKVSGQKIVDAAGNNVILRGFSPGEWANKEAYEFEFPDATSDPKSLWYWADTHINGMITNLAGSAVEQAFVSTWESNVLTDADFASMQSWGVNSVRVSINFHWLSPSQGTYLQSGWDKIDRLLGFAKKHNIKLILCLHAAPGGQSPELMCDTVDGTPHLWTEASKYQPWAIDIWKNIAARYANEPAIIGYDLLDEPLISESSSDSGGSTFRAFYVSVTNAIRTVDPNHIIFVEGAGWAGVGSDLTDLMPPWDSNLVLVHHDYNSDTAGVKSDVSSCKSIRTQYNIPIWNGETGEASNSWAKSMVSAYEGANIGWCWWTFKKVNQNSQPYTIKEPTGWSTIVAYANTFETGTKPSASVATAAFNGLAANAATASCTYNSGLITSLFGSSPAIFGLSASTASATVSAGSSTSFTVSVTPIRSFTGSVILSATGLPSGATPTFSPSTVSGGSGTSTVTINATSATAPGTYPIIITGSTTGLTQQAYVNLTVNNSNPTVAVTVTPPTASLTTGATQQFTASVTGTANTAVTWSCTGGTVSTSGFYTAPANAGTYTVTATSVADATKSNSATVTVTAVPVVTVTVSPKTASIQTSATQQFTATVTGTSTTTVTWSCTGGTINTSGLYTAPTTAGTYSVKASSTADTSKSDSATVTVTSGGTNTNIAPSGTGYIYWGMTSATANTNKTAKTGINDNNLTTDVNIDSSTGDSANAWEGASVIWSSAKTITSAAFVQGTAASSGDGWLEANVKLQFSTDGTTWTDSGWTISPAYAYSSAVSGKTYTFTGTQVTGIKGVRVVGQVRVAGNSWWWSVREIQALGY